MFSTPLYKVRPLKNLRDMLEQSEKLFGDKNAFLVRNTDGFYHGITYKQYKNDVESLAAALMELGLEDVFVAVVGENRYEWCVTYLSVVNHTGVIVPLDKELPVKEKENLLARCGASTVVFSGRYAEDMICISKKVNTIKVLINMDLSEDEQGMLSYQKLIRRGAELLKQRRGIINREIDETQMRILLYTSGTMEMAKGVMLNHKNICSNITSVCQTVQVTSSDSLLSILPLHHTYECSIGFLAMIYNGAAIAFNEGLKHISKNLKEVQPTILVTVPLILENMYRKIWEQAAKKRGLKMKLKAAIAVSDFLQGVFRLDIRKKLFKTIHENFGGKLRLVLTGAAAIDPTVSRGFRSLGVPVLQGYGLTECSPLVTGNRDRDFSYSSAGIPIPGVSIRIDNPNDSGIGEIAVKGDNVMLGYFQNEEATRHCLRDGWFFTGDLGKIGKSDFLYITGRSKNVIVTKNGKNIFPEEVEAYINKSPFVQECLVWGKYDETTGETQVNAQIFPNLDAIKEKLKIVSISAEELKKVIREVVVSVNHDMPLYKRIREFSIRETEFIKTTTRKIKRYAEKPSG